MAKHLEIRLRNDIAGMVSALRPSGCPNQKEKDSDAEPEFHCAAKIAKKRVRQHLTHPLVV